MTVFSLGQQQFRKLEIRVPHFFFEEDLLKPYRLEEEGEEEVEEIEDLKDKLRRAKEELFKKARKSPGQIDQPEQGEAGTPERRTTMQ